MYRKKAPTIFSIFLEFQLSKTSYGGKNKMIHRPNIHKAKNNLLISRFILSNSGSETQGFSSHVSECWALLKWLNSQFFYVSSKDFENCVRVLYKEFNPWHWVFGWSRTTLDRTVNSDMTYSKFVHFISHAKCTVCRWFWTLIITVSLVLCTCSMYRNWSKWQTDPIVLNFDAKPFPIETIPFPAVSVCPYSKFATQKFNFTAVYRSMFRLDGNNSRKPTANE